MSRMPIEYQTPAIEDRAIEVQMLLGDQGQRHPSPDNPSSASRLPSRRGIFAGLTEEASLSEPEADVRA
jgi:hypothetical protein